MRRPAVVVASACLVLAATGCSIDDDADSAPQSNRERPVLLQGGLEEFEKRIESERGTPVVVNKWASWCGPCRLEFPYLTSQARKRKGEVAFLGVNSNDDSGPAEDFLRENPTPFPHFEDPDVEIAGSFNAAAAWPSTAFYDSKGELAFVHQGPYVTESDLADDIERYAR